MEEEAFLKHIPPVEFCCVYGSSLHPNNHDKSALVDFILGVSDPLQWHAKNLELNRDHYASLLLRLGGQRLIVGVADNIGVGVHFNPYVRWSNKMIKYGVVHVHDLVQDLLTWQTFYLSARLHKPVRVLVDNLKVQDINSANLRAAISAALLLLPTKFSEEELYAKICSLSYTGDLRMMFAEDKNKVKKIVAGQFDLFQSIYKPFIQENQTRELLSSSQSLNHQPNILQDCSISATRTLVSSLPPMIRSRMVTKLGGTNHLAESVPIRSREEVVQCMEKILKRKVMASSARQAISGLVSAGGLNAIRYLARKMQKAWKS